MNVAEYTKTCDNTKENILKLNREGYNLSNVSKPYNPNSVIRYNPIRMVYWFSSKDAAYNSDCYFTRQRVGTMFIF